jgi:hypothetical protein
MRRTVLLVLLSLASACGGDDVATPAECNPLGTAGCVTPWPSSLYLVADSTTNTGVRVDIPEGALPSNVDLIPIDPARFNEHDGFSPASFAFTAFAGGIDDGNLVGFDDYPASTTDASPTVILDMETGERVQHFAELDANSLDFDRDEQPLYIRPVNRLKPAHRYAVGIRSSLKGADGGDLPVSGAFVDLREGKATGHARLDERRAAYDDIFAAFEAQGIARDELVVAWDFTTASDEFLTAPMLGARDAALQAMGNLAENVTYTITTDDPETDDDRLQRRVIGSFTAPLILDGTGDRAELAVDAGGAPMVTGTHDARYVAVVPACATAQAPVPMIIFGHGFFGDIGEAQGDYMVRVADELCMVVLGTEWYGMARRDITGAALALNDAGGLVGFGERIVQGIIDFITLEQLARGKFATELLVDANDQPLVDPTRVHFYGISQGHILGTTFMAYDPFVERAALSVGGTNWSLLFERSANWPNFQLIINGAYSGVMNTVLIETLMQFGLDRTENFHVAHRLLADPMPGVPPKQILLHMGIGDTQVPNLASMQQARAIGLPLLGPSVEPVYGLTETTGPLDSAMVVFDEARAFDPPATNLRHTENNGVHEAVRRENAAVRQLGGFFGTGQVVQECDGACDCAAGKCD